MSDITRYTNRVYYTKPSYSEVDEGDVILSGQIMESYTEYEEREIDTRFGTRTINVRYRPITVYYVLDATSYQRMCNDYPLE